MSDPQDKGPIILGVTWAFTSLSVIVIALRFYVRVKLANGLKAHDWLMLLALVRTSLACEAEEIFPVSAVLSQIHN